MQTQSPLSIFSILLLIAISAVYSSGSSSQSTSLGVTPVTTSNAAAKTNSSHSRPNVLGTFVTPAAAQSWEDRFNQIKALIQSIVGNSSVPSDAFLTAPELIIKHGYPFENHTIETADGYLLNYHRIPYGKNSAKCTGFRPPVLIQHGLISESTHWLTTPEYNALPYLMADECYDVWLGNARGNKYSKGHVNLTTSDPKYWDFSWHEMGVYDIPAAIDYILKTTNATKINYLGHSMGTTMFYVMGSERPEYMEKITYMVGYGSVAYTQHIAGPTHALAPVIGLPGTQDVLLAAGQGELFPDDITKYIKQTWTPACSADVVDVISCATSFFTFMGFDYNQIDYDYFPVALSTFPSSASIMSLQHYAQGILQSVVTPNFRKFDYGPVENLSKYGPLHVTSPPSYNLGNINCPKHFFTGPNDFLATPKDVKNTKGKIPNTNYTLVDFAEWNHIDFIVGKDARLYCHRPAISLFNAANGISN